MNPRPCLDYDAFKAAWEAHLTESGLPVLGWPTETVNLRTMDRSYSVRVEPLRRDDAEPFFVSAELAWDWSALQAARTTTTEEDALEEFLERRSTIRTGKPWLRVDLVLRATLPIDQPLPMPSQKVWQAWASETMARLDNIERLLPEKDLRERKGGLIEVLAWKGDPELSVRCDAEGRLLLESVKVSAWQGLTLPRAWDDSRKTEPGPDKQLRRMFKRLAGSLNAWSEVMDHLRG